jgi:hypothetical protein
MPAKKKLNGELLTSEEMQSPMGLGYVSAAERLGLIYLYDLKVIAQLLVDYANDAHEFAQTAHAQIGPHTVDQFWAALDKKADKLAVILKGKNHAYMATTWFTDPNQMAAHLSRWLETRKLDHPANPIGKKDPVRGCCRDFMAFFPELYEGAITGQGKIPDITLSAEHIKNYTAAFMGVDVATVDLPIHTGIQPTAKTLEEEQTEDDKLSETPE